MPKLSDLTSADQIAAIELADPEIRREHDRTALAHAVAMRVIGYRVERGLSQTALARLLGMHQPLLPGWKLANTNRHWPCCRASRQGLASSFTSTSHRRPSACAISPEARL